VKEALLGPSPPERLTVTIPGSGAKLIGGGKQIEVTRQEAEHVLVEGFLPRVALDEKPVVHRSGFQEFGLPFAPEDKALIRARMEFVNRPAAAVVAVMAEGSPR